MTPLKSSQVAQQANVNVETLRYYEREGLLPTPSRTESGYRQYSETDVARVQFIKRAQHLGFTLDEIKDLLSLRQHPDDSAGPVKQLALDKIELIDTKIEALQQMKTVLQDLASACPGSHGTIDYCPILKAFEHTHCEHSTKGGD